MIDPLLVLEPERLASAAAAGNGGGSVQAYVTISVPFRLLAQLNEGKFHLAEHDDPGNSW